MQQHASQTNIYSIGSKQPGLKLLESIGSRNRPREERLNLGSLLDDKNLRESFNFTLGRLKLDSPDNKRQTGIAYQQQQSNVKIKTLEAFLTSRRSSSKEKQRDNECPTTKRRIYLKDKPESPQSEGIESPDLAASRDPDSYSNRQLAQLMHSLKQFMKEKDDRILELEAENERLRCLNRIGKV